MGGDLVSLRMLVVTAAPSQQQLWRRGAALASVPLEFSADAPPVAIKALAAGGVDICVVDDALSETDQTRVMAAARASRSVPMLVMATARDAARPDNVGGAFAKPGTDEEARKLVELCVRAKIPTRVLIVDDSATMRGIVRKILSASRFALDVQEASEGIAAIEQLGGGNFGLVFLDYNMPGLNGFETLSEIKRVAPGVSVVMMTSTIDNVIADRAHASGALAFLKKPFYPADIDAVLERHYGLSGSL
jgi:CheY-like chemotaxis protein